MNNKEEETALPLNVQQHYMLTIHAYVSMAYSIHPRKNLAHPP